MRLKDNIVKEMTWDLYRALKNPEYPLFNMEDFLREWEKSEDTNFLSYCSRLYTQALNSYNEGIIIKIQNGELSDGNLNNSDFL